LKEIHLGYGFDVIIGIIAHLAQMQFAGSHVDESHPNFSSGEASTVRNSWNDNIIFKKSA